MEAAQPGEPRHRDLVVIGASAGGVETLKEVASGLPANLQAAICIVLHIAPESPSALAGILRRAGRLPCRPASDGDSLAPGQILVAPPDRHLVVEDGRVRVTVGPRENNHRPSVDVLFRTAAVERGANVIGIILSGTRDDGTAGLAVIKARGGAAIVQDPKDALYPGMPESALHHVSVDAVVPLQSDRRDNRSDGERRRSTAGNGPDRAGRRQGRRTERRHRDLPGVRWGAQRAHRGGNDAVGVPSRPPLFARDARRRAGR